MKRHFTPVLKKDEGWWIGWVERIPGVNCQGKPLSELVRNLRSPLNVALDFKRKEAE